MDQWEATQQERFGEILNQNVDRLLRSTSTEFNFLEIREKVHNVLTYVHLIQDNFDFWAQLPEDRRDNINNVLNNLISIFSRFEQFDPKQNNSWQERTSIVEQFNNWYRGFYEAIVSNVDSYLGRKAYSRELSGEFGREAKKELTEIRKVKKEIDNIRLQVDDAAKVAGDIASTATSISFDDQAKEHENSADKWFWGIIGFSIVALLIALSVIYEILIEIKDKKLLDNAEADIFKVAILAFLYIGIRFTIRNYSANKHLYIVNRHRANILKSMEAFRTSAVDDNTKDSVLLAAVGAAFAQQETGFITTKEGAGSDDDDLISIVKTASGK